MIGHPASSSGDTVHPALSVIIFSTTSGAGATDLLALLGILTARSTTYHAGPEGSSTRFRDARLGARCDHGRPAGFDVPSRPSRAGVAGIFAVAIVVAVAQGSLRSRPTCRPDCSDPLDLLRPGLGGDRRIAALGAVVAVCCTAMIYRSLKPVPRWHNGWVLPRLLAGRLDERRVVAGVSALWFLLQTRRSASLALAATGLTALVKIGYWRFIDGESATSAAATQRDWSSREPCVCSRRHTPPELSPEGNGLRDRPEARDQASPHCPHDRLRLPFLLSLAALVAAGWPAAVAALLAALLGMVGDLRRALAFFAEARRTARDSRTTAKPQSEWGHRAEAGIGREACCRALAVEIM